MYFLNLDSPSMTPMVEDTELLSDIQTYHYHITTLLTTTDTASKLYVLLNVCGNSEEVVL